MLHERDDPADAVVQKFRSLKPLERDGLAATPRLHDLLDALHDLERTWRVDLGDVG